MAILKKLKNLFEKNKTSFEEVTHRTVFTAFDMAKTLSVKMDQVVKTILVKADKNYALILLPASRRLNLKKVAKALRAVKIQIADEGVMKKFFKVEPGAMTPFGALYDLPVYADKALVKAKKVFVRAGTFRDSVSVKTKDLLTLAQAKMVDIGAAVKAVKPTGKKRNKR